MRQKLYSVHNMTADYNRVFVKLKYLSKLQQFTSVKATGEEIFNVDLVWKSRVDSRIVSATLHCIGLLPVLEYINHPYKELNLHTSTRSELL